MMPVTPSELFSLAQILDVHAGAPPPNPVCAECLAVPVDRPGRYCEKCNRETILADRRRRLTRARASIPPVFRELRFDSIELGKRVAAPDEILAAVRRCADLPLIRARVVLVGHAGAGKTSLACAMLNTVIDQGLEDGQHSSVYYRAARARFVDAVELRRAVLNHPLGEGDAPLVTMALSASVLVLDDVGQELDMRTATNPVPEVVRARHAEGKTTWITTFLDVDGLARGYGDGTARRMLDGAELIGIGETA